MPVPSLPQELIDSIIEHARDDSHALAYCSLVRRPWRATAQRELFYNFKVDISRRPLAYLIAFLSSSLGACTETVHRAPIASYVRHLTVRSAGKHDGFGIIISGRLPELTESVPNLKTLTLEALRMEVDDSCAECSQHLYRVSLKDVVVQRGTADELVICLSSLYNLRALHLSNVSFENRDELPAFPVLGPECLETLTLRSRFMPPSLLDMFSHGTLKNLDIACYTPRDVYALGHFLDTAGSALAHLALDLSRYLVKYPSAPDEALDRVTLGRCPALRALTLRTAFLAEPWAGLPFNAAGLRAAAQVFASAPAGLHTLTLALALDGDAGSDGAFVRPLAAQFDAELAWLARVGTERPALRAVRWMWGYARKAGRPRAGPVEARLGAALTALVEARLPGLREAGVLGFVDGDEDVWG